MTREDCSPPSSARAARLGYKIVVSAFILLHVSSVVWWNIPAENFDAEPLPARLPARFVSAEQKLFSWRHHASATSVLARTLEAYTMGSATWQSWHFFAPNPLSVDRYLTVYAVLEEGKDGQPIYDPTPVYTSYPGALGETPHRFADGKLLFAPYSPDETLALALTDETFAPEVEPFAYHWAEVYSAEKGRHPLGVDVLVHIYAVPPAFSGISPRDVELESWRAGWFRY